MEAGFLLDKCLLQTFNANTLQNCNSFDCSHSDLNEFFREDLLHYSDELLGKTFCFTLESNPKEIVCAFTLSNDSIKTRHLPNNRKKKVNQSIPSRKRMNTYPAVLIGRLGIKKEYRNITGETDRTGRQLMNFIKSWFISDEHSSACRFLVVDSYNEPAPLKYYQDNDFKFLFSTKLQEKEYTGLIKDTDVLKTRLMYFDLIELKG